MPAHPLKRLAVVAVLAFVLLWPVAGDQLRAAVTPDAAGCAHSSDLPDPTSTPVARAAILCLLNRERQKRGLNPLREDPALQRAAQAHAEDMGRRNFYAHRNPDGRSPDDRIRAAGFDGVTTGENIHWGRGTPASPTSIVRDWMNSPGHRANILRATFNRVGTGVGYDSPDGVPYDRVGVYVNNFGD